MEVSGQFHAPATLPLVKYFSLPIVQEVEWVPEPVWTRWWREEIPDRSNSGLVDSNSARGMDVSPCFSASYRSVWL
jgi:hypothetical protein